LPSLSPPSFRGAPARTSLLRVFFKELNRTGLVVVRDELRLEKGFTTMWQTQKVVQ